MAKRTTAPERPGESIQAQNPVMRPQSFRLPQRGGDPHFGLSKAAWYVAEKRGLVKVTRIIQPGKTRGITLIDYASAAAYIASVFGKVGAA